MLASPVAAYFRPTLKLQDFDHEIWRKLSTEGEGKMHMHSTAALPKDARRGSTA
jgi:hypothetical protein